ncbi:hypothetical protein WJ0W_007166 [Paenibacillus melissococcoides]|uniref:Uncharacterized protein n=1 Tax=Paenibacillus melissococcoides TaxID=2912268 RepID=A0ABM9G917_9BACL|nr:MULTISPECIES: hypothetical protein [Paenibacillus]GIO82980.1 hypothetical protein J6TS7_65900 [Paenibacillus dendritiformis]CAH8248498.1 hypothetical protein WJ0W_007166 [Paenibacillus melissococcoides]CAH8722030.1 hypothetical protein HTL2_006659 [Paenibacillus melissococcoides]CAH8722031.1 hypothetical protein WDD9_006585 [Paenibacillus melissococcoides]
MSKKETNFMTWLILGAYAVALYVIANQFKHDISPEMATEFMGVINGGKPILYYALTYGMLYGSLITVGTFLAFRLAYWIPYWIWKGKGTNEAM